MKLKDLKNYSIYHGKWETSLLAPSGYTAAQMMHSENRLDKDTALLAAARFRASEEMYQELALTEKMITEILSDGNLASGLADALVLQRDRIRAVLSLANNTNETL